MSQTTITSEALPSQRMEWNAVGAVIAALIGLLALAVSGYTALLQREQVRAEVWPYLQSVITIEQESLTISIQNKGVGPALVGGLRVYVDGKAQRTWPDIFDALGLSDLRHTRASTINGVVIAPGETIQQIGLDQAADSQRLLDRYPRMALALCYCSTLGDCWLLDEREHRPARRRTQVAVCPARSSNELIDNDRVPPGPAGQTEAADAARQPAGDHRHEADVRIQGGSPRGAFIPTHAPGQLTLNHWSRAGASPSDRSH